MSIDTGMSGNLFGGNYFNMNHRHLTGDLNKIETSFKTLERGGPDGKPLGYVLKIHPITKKKKRRARPIEEALVDEIPINQKKVVDYDEDDEDYDPRDYTNDDPDGINEYYRKKREEESKEDL